MSYDSSNPEHVTDRKKKARADAETRENDIRWLMSDPRGRRIVWAFLEETGIYRSSFTGNSTTFFNEGRRDVGLKLLAEINEIAVDQYTLMVKEAHDGR